MIGVPAEFDGLTGIVHRDDPTACVGTVEGAGSNHVVRHDAIVWEDYRLTMATSSGSDVMDVSDLTDCDITDEELTALALAADPDQEIDVDALPLSAYRNEFPELLPEWYMPTPAYSSTRRNAVIGAVVIFSLLFINALGLCITYGRLEVPF